MLDARGLVASKIPRYAHVICRLFYNVARIFRERGSPASPQEYIYYFHYRTSISFDDDISLIWGYYDIHHYYTRPAAR